MSSYHEDQQKSSRIANPSAGIEGINHAVRGLYAFKRPATYKELAKPAGVSDVYMSISLSASRHVGLTKLSGQRGLYELTEMGEVEVKFYCPRCGWTLNSGKNPKLGHEVKCPTCGNIFKLTWKNVDPDIEEIKE